MRALAGTMVSLPPLARYGVAVAAAAATLALMSLRLWLNPGWGGRFGFLTCMPAIMLSGWVGGGGPGVLATLLCATGAYYWLLDPTGTWGLTYKSQLLSVALLIAVGAVISALNEEWRRSVAAAIRSRERLRVALERAREAHEAEQAAREAADTSAEHLRLALQAGRMGTWEYTLRTGKASCSPACEAMHGYSPGGLPDTFEAVIDEIHAADRERVLRAAEQTLQERRPYEVEYRAFGTDGTVRWVEARGELVLDEADQPDRLVGVCADISERKCAETALRRSAAWLAGQKEAFQAAVNGAPLEVSLGILIRTAIEQTGGDARCAFYIVDPGGTELRHVTGMPAPYDRPVNIKIGREAPGCGLAVSTGQPVITPDVTRTPRWQEWLSVAEAYGFRACWSFPVETAAGRIVGSFAMYFKEPRDATAADRELAAALTHSGAIIISRHQESQERARVAQELEAASRQKDEFLALLGHELRNPLFPIATASELLSRTLAEDGRARFAAEVIKRQSAQLMRLVDDLLDIGRITQGRIQLQQMPLELSEVIAQAVETVEPRLREKLHELSVRSGEVPLYVHGDFARLVQCLGNVLANAVKYTPARGHIRIETHAEADTAVLSVCDDGVGIAPELLPRVFELFVQGDQTLDRAEGGLGIGLSVVKRLIHMHGGEVAAESAGPGTGTRMEIRLPRIAPPAGSAVSPDGLGAAPRRVLIVEDNADAANSLAILLGMAGHQTMVACDGREALDVIDSFKPQVALVDIGLPQINGYQLAQRVRTNLTLAGLRLIAVTGYGQAEDRERARAAGFDEHLVKPVSLAALERALAALGPPAAGDGPLDQAAEGH